MCSQKLASSDTPLNFYQYDDVLINIFKQLSRNSVELWAVSSTCTRWFRIIRKLFSTNDRRISTTSVVTRVDMLSLIEGEGKILKRNPLPSELFLRAVRFGTVENVSALMERISIILTVKHYMEAAYGGNFPVLKWLKEKDCPRGDHGSVFSAACTYGDIDIMQWMVKEDFPKTEQVFSSTVARGKNCSLKNMEWLMSLGTPKTSNAINIALVCKCDINVIEWLLGNGFPTSRVELEYGSNSDIKILKLLVKNGAPTSSVYATSAAANVGNFKNLRWMIKKGFPLSEDVFSRAVKHGNISELAWLRDIGATMNADAFSLAANAGHLHVMEWLLEIKCPYDETAFDSAFSGGIEVMQWLFDRKFPVGEFVLSRAIGCRNFSTSKLDWFKDHGLPLGNIQNALEASIEFELLEAAEWLINVGAKIDNEMLRRISLSSRFEAMKWLISKKHVFDIEHTKSLTHTDLDIFDLFVSHGLCDIKQRPKIHWIDETKYPSPSNEH